MDKQPRRAQLDFAVGDHPLDRLFVRERRAESVSLAHPIDREMKRRLGEADDGRGIGNARVDKPGFCKLESLAFLAEPVLDRHFAVDERQFIGGVGADDRDRLIAEALEFLLDDEGGDAVCGPCSGRCARTLGPNSIARRPEIQSFVPLRT